MPPAAIVGNRPSPDPWLLLRLEAPKAHARGCGHRDTGWGVQGSGARPLLLSLTGSVTFALQAQGSSTKTRGQGALVQLVALKTGTQKGLLLPVPHKLWHRTGFVGGTVFDMEAQREAWGGYSGSPRTHVPPQWKIVLILKLGLE